MNVSDDFGLRKNLILWQIIIKAMMMRWRAEEIAPDDLINWSNIKRISILYMYT